MLEEYKRLLRERGLSGKFMAEMLGLSYSSYRAMTGKNAKVVPKWVISFVMACNSEGELCLKKNASNRKRL